MEAVRQSQIVVFSGSGPISHSDARDLARRLGCEVSGTVRQGVNVLIVGDKASNIKVRQAAELGIRVVTYDEWIAETGAASMLTAAEQDASILHIPTPFPDDHMASESQMPSLRAFYATQTIEGLTDGQAGNLLDYRDFAQAVVTNLDSKIYGEPKRLLAEKIAIYVSRRRRLSEEVIAFMRAQFRDAKMDPASLPQAVFKTNAYAEVEDHFG